MRDFRVIKLLTGTGRKRTQGHACSVFSTGLNNHAGEHLLDLKPGESLRCSRPSQALPIDKWACPSIEYVEMQLATSAGAGIQLATCKPKLNRLQHR